MEITSNFSNINSDTTVNKNNYPNKGVISSENLELDHIYTNMKDAIDSKNPVSINKDVWNNNKLYYEFKDNDAILITNSDGVALGYTNKNYINLYDAALGNDDINTSMCSSNNSYILNELTTGMCQSSNSYSPKNTKISVSTDNLGNKIFKDENNQIIKKITPNKDIIYYNDNKIIKAEYANGDVSNYINGKINSTILSDGTIFKYANGNIIEKDFTNGDRLLYDSNGNIIEKVLPDGTIKKLNNLYNSITDDISNGNSFIITNEVINDFKRKLNEFNDIDTNLDKDKLLHYYVYVNDYFSDSISFSEKMNYCKKLINQDNNNYNKILYSTPILKNGRINAKNNNFFNDCEYSGEYLEYYNEYDINVKVPLVSYSMDDENNIITKNVTEEEIAKISSISSEYYCGIMKNSNNYSKKFSDAINNNLKDIIMFYSDKDFDTNWAAYTIRKNSDSTTSEVVIRLDQVESSYDYMIDAYTHELGHVYAETTGTGENVIDISPKWKKVYDQINENDPDCSLLRDYAHSSSVECFAECITEYFASGLNSAFNPNDLKVVDIDIDGYDNLYDYLTNILVEE